MSPARPHGVKDACRLLNLEDSITTHHISPAGSVHRDSPAAGYPMERGVVWRRRKRKNSSMEDDVQKFYQSWQAYAPGQEGRLRHDESAVPGDSEEPRIFRLW
ncbi:hypothetical protein NC651_007151 [Populus alba x Populus x berolinensis]|nr:hypothetical protein NC651_007151 [Populus alba x Populus x berolinensis]